MRGIAVLSVFLLLLWTTAATAKRVIEIPVSTTSEIIRLPDLGIELLDARIERTNPLLNRSAQHVRWCPENGFVTGLAEADALLQLNAADIRFHDRGEYIPHPDHRGPRRTLDMPMQWGWPRLMVGWPTLYGHTTTIGDFDGNGDLEVQISNIENYFYVWQHDGAFYPGYPLDPIILWLPGDPPSAVTWVSTAAIETGALGDIDGDDGNEYVYGCAIGYLCVYQPQGSMDGFPWMLDTALFTGVPALVDLDGFAGDEIVINTYDYFDGFPQNDPQVHVYYPDHSEMFGWPQHLPRKSDSSPAVGDLDNDGQLEVVIGCGQDNTGPGQIFAWHADGSLVDGFPITNLFNVGSTPTIADLDGDSLQEIIIRVKFMDSDINGVYAFDYQGHVKPGFPAPVSSGHPDGACAVGDIDGDGDLEIAFGSLEAVDLGRVYAWHHDGTPVTGFPQLVGATWVDGSVAM
ncbi:MAG: FG-GAP repeat domain-containing protein, partial [Calditrichota bacterium]